MITITITEAVLVPATEDETGYWNCKLIVDQDGTAWLLPATAPASLAQNELQAYFDAQADSLWVIADSKQIPATVADATYGAKQWYIDNPNAALLFTLSIDDLDAAIQNRTAGQETLLLKTLAMAVRVLAKREGLV
jgi:hypothetical protein